MITLIILYQFIPPVMGSIICLLKHLFIWVRFLFSNRIVVFISCNLPFPYLQISIYALLFIILQYIFKFKTQ